MTTVRTHEAYLSDIVALARRGLTLKSWPNAGAKILRPEGYDAAPVLAAIDAIKLVYGGGSAGAGVRGVTWYNRWQNGGEQANPFVELCAFGESDPVQLCGTTLHELGHVVAGAGAGHDSIWKAACHLLGLRRARASGQSYHAADFAPHIRYPLAVIEPPADGEPVASGFSGFGIGPGLIAPRPCGAGIGTKGGRSRGPGSGSRDLKCYCGGCGYICRASARWLDTGAPICPCGAGPMVDCRSE